MAAIYLGGLAGETKDADLALELLNKAAAENDNQAMFELAQYYLEIGGPEKVDDYKAWEWLNKAADSGNPNALASLGSVLFDGKTFGARKIEADPAIASARRQSREEGIAIRHRELDRRTPTWSEVMGDQ